MGVFLGTHENRFDAKGRVSIPAGFRSVLRSQQTEGDALMILRPSHTLPCVEAWPASAFARLTEPLDRLNMFSDDHDDLAAALYADAYPMEPDREGRIILPDFLREHAGLTDSPQAAFMGLGRIFQIWEPEAARARREEARQRSRRVSIPAPGRPDPNGEPA
ncbi:division/cell wall cluster transcriptional repressor MraZ [Acetobacter sp. TBRC 12305]|uniref:Transcriptional regulator MraZ n=1 Tax=Acetobacter garciniae TaxID=2817435 RepID=A0A939HRC1_9PROT|nr:division/cell wall cluster transcriptional repressor MraZ [Acetobacter garciniae]MBX0346111.1 division/cell wall cluster transcriptional repressor MraZ [Acetobacter garciniae]